MALFGRERDISLFRHVNRELIWDIITQQIGYYKVILEETYTNIYGEAMEKFLTDPVLLNCLITRGDQDWSSDDFGPDVNRTMEFAFLRDDLVDTITVCQVGDYILWENRYFEVDSVIDNQLFVGKDPAYPYTKGLQHYGWDTSIKCVTHLVPADKLGITKERA